MTKLQEAIQRGIHKVSDQLHRQTMCGGPEVLYVSPRVYTEIERMDGFYDGTYCNRYHIVKTNAFIAGPDVYAIVPRGRLTYTCEPTDSTPIVDAEGLDTLLDIPHINIEVVREIQLAVDATFEFTKEEWEELND